MNIPIPPIPNEYRMVNLHGTDLAEANGHQVMGLYDAIYEALDESKIEMFYNWRFADILLPPAYVVIDDSTVGEFIINEEISVKSDDTISLIGVTRIPVIDPLSVVENGVYSVPAGVDGFSPVTVTVPLPPPPVLVSLNATENGNYIPGIGEDGFSDVTVNVPDIPAVVETLSVNTNGTFTPPSGVDGYAPVIVNVPDIPPVTVPLSVIQNGVYTPEQGVDGFDEVTVNLPCPLIPTDFYGLAYCYNALNGSFYYQGERNQCMSFFHVSAGNYVVFLSQPVSTRFRALFFAGKTYEDFKEYAENPHEPTTQLYSSTINITGGVELAGDRLRECFYFTASSDGEVVVGSSNVSALVPVYLFKITN